MAKINQDLLGRLKNKIGVGNTRVYALIQKIAAEQRIKRHLAALLLAGQYGISVQKYASSQDLDELRGIPNHVALPTISSSPAVSVRQNGKKSAKRSKTKENTIFVVHGRDYLLRDSMYEFLGALGLKPQEWNHAIRSARGRGGNPYVNDAVTKIMEEAQSIVVLLSPDDEARLKPHFVVGSKERKTEGDLRGQARPNVIFETGIAIGAHHKKTVIVRVGDVKPFTDIGGMHIAQLTDAPASRHDLANRLEKLGCKIDRVGDHWLRAGTFRPTKGLSFRKSAKSRRANRKG